MKKISFTIVLAVYSFVSFSQSTLWTKDERNNLYDDCMGYLTKFKNTDVEQRESISLCYLDEITKKYTKQDFQQKIDIEVKRIKDGVINQCAKNLGINLTTAQIPEKKEETKIVVVEKKEEPKPTKKTLTRELLIGRWKTDKGSTIEFKEDGKYSEVNLKGKISSGDWFLDGKVLTISIQKTKTQVITNNEKTKIAASIYEFESFSTDFIKYSKIGIPETIQANRLK